MLSVFKYTMETLYNILGFCIINFDGYEISLLEIALGFALVCILFWALGKMFN